MGENKLETYTIKEYLELEKVALERHEYENGKIIQMSSSTLNHSMINTNFSSLIKTDCFVLSCQVKVYIEAVNSYVYPDTMVVCGKIEESPHTNHALTNPILIVEVLSKSTGSYDRGAKFRKYCTLPSFQEYVLIDQYEAVVDILVRNENNDWTLRTTSGLDQSVYLKSIDASIKLADIYKNVDFIQI